MYILFSRPPHVRFLVQDPPRALDWLRVAVRLPWSPPTWDSPSGPSWSFITLTCVSYRFDVCVLFISLCTVALVEFLSGIFFNVTFHLKYSPFFCQSMSLILNIFFNSLYFLVFVEYDLLCLLTILVDLFPSGVVTSAYELVLRRDRFSSEPLCQDCGRNSSQCCPMCLAWPQQYLVYQISCVLIS